MGISFKMANRSLLKHLQNLIPSNPMRPNHDSGSNVEEDEFRPSPSQVLLPDYLTARSVNRDSLPVIEYATFRSHNGEEDDDDSRCAVCLSRIEAWHNVRELGNCGHAFHVECLDSWMDGGGGTCPVCRAHLVSGHGEEEEEVSHGKDPWRSQRMVYLFGEDCLME